MTKPTEQIDKLILLRYKTLGPKDEFNIMSAQIRESC